MVQLSCRGARHECVSKPSEGSIVRRQSEPEEVAGVIEAPGPDLPAGQVRMDCQRVGVTRETEQRSAAGHVKTCRAQDVVEPYRLPAQPGARRLDPLAIGQCAAPDDKRRPGHWPWSERSGDLGGNIDARDRKAEPQSGQAKEFAERAQYDDREFSAEFDHAALWNDIGEGLIDDQAAAEPVEPARRFGNRVARCDASIGIVRIDDDGVGDSRWQSVEACRHNLAPGAREGRGVLVVRGAADRDRTAGHDVRQDLDQRLRARGECNPDTGRNLVCLARGLDEAQLRGAIGQTLPALRRKFVRDRVGPGIDPGRQVEPGFRRAAKFRNRLAEVAAMLHGRVMPLSRRLREGGVAVGVLVFSLLATNAYALDQPRIASINMCTDQLLLTLADPEQIVGLSPYSRDAARSWAAEAAARYPKLSGEAEDVLVLKPDFVVAGRFTKRATRELLKAEGFRVEEFDAVRTLDETRRQISRMGELVGHADRAAAAIARVDAAIARAREVVARKPLRVLALSRRGWVSGGDSLTSSLLSTIGLANAASQLGYRLGGFASLETIVSLKPDLLLLSESGNFAEDQGTAFLLHPALEQLYPPDKRIVMPERLTVCGGPMLADALEKLVSELDRVEH